MKNTFLKKVARPLLFAGEVCLLTGVTLLSVFPISCKATTSGIEIIGINYTVPTLENYTVVSSNELVLEFSEEVTLLSGIVSPFISTVSDSDEHSSTESLSPALLSATGIDGGIPIELNYSEDRKTVNVNLTKETDIGKKYKLYGEVENKKGASLTFAVSFVGYNSCIPNLLLSEVHDGTTTFGVYEYVEFIALSDGNLSGLVVKSVADGDEGEFLFPPIEVKKGDYITVHYRPGKDVDVSTCISETTDDKTLCKAVGSSDNSWDLWADNTKARLGASQDVITLENINNGEILQALVYSISKISKKDTTDWTNDKFKNKAIFAVENGVWEPSGDFSDAFIFPTSPSIIRTNVSEIIESYENDTLAYPFASNATEWKRIPDGELSPGLDNSLTPFKKK